MLLATVLLWALNIDRVAVRRHARLPAARLRDDAVLRGDPALLVLHVVARALASGSPAATCRSCCSRRLLIFLNQLAFVYGVDLTSASTVGLDPRHDADLGGDLRDARRARAAARTFWLAALVSFVRGRADRRRRERRALRATSSATCSRCLAAATWAAYSVTIAPLMRRYSPFRISSLVLALGWVPLALVSIPQLTSQSYRRLRLARWARASRSRSSGRSSSRTSSGSPRSTGSGRRARRSSRTSSRSSRSLLRGAAARREPERARARGRRRDRARDRDRPAWRPHLGGRPRARVAAAAWATMHRE